MNTTDIYRVIFTLFYALYFTMTITNTGKLHPFETATMCQKGYPHSWWRFCVSFILLDLLPLLYFYLVFKWLYKLPTFSFWCLLLLFLLSMSGLGFYRIHFGVMLIKCKNSYLFYDKIKYGNEVRELPPALGEELGQRPDFYKLPASHIGPGIIWASIPFVLFLLAIQLYCWAVVTLLVSLALLLLVKCCHKVFHPKE